MSEPPSKRKKKAQPPMALSKSVVAIAERLTPLLRLEETRTLETEEMWMVSIPAREGSKFLRYLQACVPLPAEKSHLKRVQKLGNEGGSQPRLLVLVGSTANIPDPVAVVTASGVEGAGEPERRDVPRHIPRTKKQFEEARPLWPISFHESPMSTPLPETLSEGELLEIDKWMLTVLEMKEASTCSDLEAALIVDAATGKMIGCSDNPKGGLPGASPLRHAALAAIDAVARAHAAAASHGGAEGVLEDGGGEPPALGKRKRQDSVGDGDAAPSGGPVQYLCKGMDLYISGEPCIMCSMALVHSRIRRVVYHTPNPHFGGMGSRVSIHSEKGVNHNFEAYRYATVGEGSPS